MANFLWFSGKVVEINDFWSDNRKDTGCSKMYTIKNLNGDIINFIASPSTYFVDYKNIQMGDNITAFYDANQPVPLIYPPQYRARVISLNSHTHNITVSHFNRRLISSDGTLMLNIAPTTKILLTNGQSFTGELANRDLVVIYGSSTKSIPAQTTPTKVVVLCDQ